MSNAQDYAAALDAAKKLAIEQIQTPRIPVGVFLQEGENLHQTALTDREQLAAAGLPEQTINALPQYAGACREAQSLWNKDLNARQAAEQQWAVQSPLGYSLRDRLLHAFSYAFRADEALSKKVQAIREGNGHADMIQDLSDLAVLGRANAPLLETIRLNLGELDTAQNLSSSLAELLAQANGERLSDNESKIMRDRMYTLLKQAVDEIYACGRYVFWNDDKRLKMYRSAYENSHRTKSKKEVEMVK